MLNEFLEIIKNSINNLCAKYIERNLSDEMLPIFYVAGSQTLPAPLEQKEEEEMIKNQKQMKENMPEKHQQKGI